MAKKQTSGFNKSGIDSLAQDKPVVYKILNAAGDNVYTGIAKRGRVADRLKEHLPGAKDAIPGGKKVRIEQKPSIDEARKSEARIIKRSKPKHNKQS